MHYVYVLHTFLFTLRLLLNNDYICFLNIFYKRNFKDRWVSTRHGEICFKVRSNYSNVTESSRYSKLYETGASARDGIILAGGLFGILLGSEVKRNGADETRHFLAEASALLPTSPDILFPHPFFFRRFTLLAIPSQRTLTYTRATARAIPSAAY